MNDDDKTKTELVMENVHLRRKLAEAEARAGRVTDELKECRALVEELEARDDLTDRERRVLDMWPRFDDGEPVMVGDECVDEDGDDCAVHGVAFDDIGAALVDSDGFHAFLNEGARVRRPAPEVPNADGMPDSWERLEEDALQLDIGLDETTDDYPRMSCVRDLVSRAKKLAGVE